jgi:hypothetical protein
MKTAKALQPSHILPNYVLVETNAALCVLNEVFF